MPAGSATERASRACIECHGQLMQIVAFVEHHQIQTLDGFKYLRAARALNVAASGEIDRDHAQLTCISSPFTVS